eukprot:gene33920-43822_t
MVKIYKKIFPRIDVSHVSHSVSAVASQVSADMTAHPSVMQKQLALAQKKIEAYRKQIEFLQNHVENSEVERIFEKLKRAVIEKDGEIVKLQSENQSLRQIAREQGKHIMNQEIIRNGHSDGETSKSQEKQIEVLMTHIRRLNSTLGECRKKERLTAETNEEFKKQNLKLTRKITTLNRNFEMLKAAAAIKKSPRPGEESGNQTEREANLTEEEIETLLALRKKSRKKTAVEAAVTTSAADLEKMKKQKDLIARLEKSIRIQKTGFQHEIHGLKTELERYKAEKKKAETDLVSQESSFKQQIAAIKQLKDKYEDLLERNRKLQAASEIFGRSKPPPSPLPPVISTIPILEPRPPSTGRPNNHSSISGRPVAILNPAPKGTIISEEDGEKDNTSTIGFFITDMTELKLEN